MLINVRIVNSPVKTGLTRHLFPSLFRPTGHLAYSKSFKLHYHKYRCRSEKNVLPLVIRNANIIIIAARSSIRKIASSTSNRKATAMHITIRRGRIRPSQIAASLGCKLATLVYPGSHGRCRLQCPIRIKGSYGRRMPGASRGRL